MQIFFDAEEKWTVKWNLKSPKANLTGRLLALDNDGEAWIETSVTYPTEGDARDALQSAEMHAEIDDDAPYQHFATMRNKANMFPPAPES
jgi:hypothetical protein